MIRLPILTYHSADSTGSVLSITATLRRRQLEFLPGAGYRALSLSEAGAALAKEVLCFRSLDRYYFR